ncbi:0f984c18-3136-453f-8923-d58648c66e08 [Thermothielavioides terrestris]|nr:0f984c18-3136-453f-8923-d58648c66e08 [Thermothielavioides terrestris]
MQYNSC